MGERKLGTIETLLVAIAVATGNNLSYGMSLQETEAHRISVPMGQRSGLRNRTIQF